MLNIIVCEAIGIANVDLEMILIVGYHMTVEQERERMHRYRSALILSQGLRFSVVFIKFTPDKAIVSRESHKLRHKTSKSRILQVPFRNNYGFIMNSYNLQGFLGSFSIRYLQHFKIRLLVSIAYKHPRMQWYVFYDSAMAFRLGLAKLELLTPLMTFDPDIKKTLKYTGKMHCSSLNQNILLCLILEIKIL